MGKVTLSDWNIGDNELSIILTSFYVKIIICKNASFIYYRLEVIIENEIVLIFNFYSLNDAIKFTEETINNCTSIEEIIDYYKELFESGKFKSMIKKSKY